MINSNPFNKTSRDKSQILIEVGRPKVALLQSGGNTRKIRFDATPAMSRSLKK